MDPKDIVDLIAGWRNKVYAYPGTIEVERSIKVHGLVLGVVDWDRSLHIRPLGDEVDERL